MLTAKTPRLLERTLVMLVALAVLLSAGVASAAGRVEWGKRTIKERTDTKSWKIEIKIFLSKPPDIAHVPMKFEFKPTAYYERARVDDTSNPNNKKGIVNERKVPLQNRQPLIESVDVGFLDPGRGETQSRTKFSFRVTRAHGFEAGEYTVKIRDARNGQTIGRPTKLVFEGENEIIDRRTMSFVDDSGKKKKSKMKKVGPDGVEDGDDEGASSNDEPVFTGVEETGEGEDYDEGGAMDDEGEGGLDKPPEIKEKPGGCGCRVNGSTVPGTAALGLGLGLGLLGARRRRRRAAA